MEAPAQPLSVQSSFIGVGTVTAAEAKVETEVNAGERERKTGAFYESPW